MVQFSITGSSLHIRYQTQMISIFQASYEHHHKTISRDSHDLKLSRNSRELSKT